MKTKRTLLNYQQRDRLEKKRIARAKKSKVRRIIEDILLLDEFDKVLKTIDKE